MTTAIKDNLNAADLALAVRAVNALLDALDAPVRFDAETLQAGKVDVPVPGGFGSLFKTVSIYATQSRAGGC